MDNAQPKPETSALDLREHVARAIEAELNRDFDVWFERWGTPAGIIDDAPEPPSRWETSSHKIAQAAIRAVLEGIMEPGFEAIGAGEEAVIDNFGNWAQAVLELPPELTPGSQGPLRDAGLVRWQAMIRHIIERERGDTTSKPQPNPETSALDLREYVARALHLRDLHRELPETTGWTNADDVWRRIGNRGHDFYRENADTAIRATLEGVMEPGDHALSVGHANGVRKDAIWTGMTEEMALILLKKYLPTAWQAMVRRLLDENK